MNEQPRARRFLHSMQLATMLLGVAAPALGAPLAVPPLTDGTNPDHRPGKFVWIDLFTSDPAAARQFYGELFGWTFDTLGDAAKQYTLASLDGEQVAGIVQRTGARADTRAARWIAYMSVADVAATASLVQQQGGTVLLEPRPVPDRGTMAVLADPDRAPFGIIHSSSGDPLDALAMPGDWIWALYQSLDPQRAAAFFQQLADYEVVADERFPERDVYLLVANGFARAALSGIPADKVSAVRPDWLYFVRVTDIDATLTEATALGAQIIVAPRPDLLDGRIAVVRDPTGAPLGLMEWQPPAAGGAQ